MGKKVVIDTEEGIGCETCVERCADVFAFNAADEKAGESFYPKADRRIAFKRP